MRMSLDQKIKFTKPKLLVPIHRFGMSSVLMLIYVWIHYKMLNSYWYYLCITYKHLKKKKIKVIFHRHTPVLYNVQIVNGDCTIQGWTITNSINIYFSIRKKNGYKSSICNIIKIKFIEAGIIWENRWFYFSINISKTLNWHFLQLD